MTSSKPFPTLRSKYNYATPKRIFPKFPGPQDSVTGYAPHSLLFLPLVSTLEEAESAERGGVKKRKHRGESEKLAPPVLPPGHSPGRGSDIKPGVADSQTRNFIIKLGSTSTLPRRLFL